MLDSCGSEGLVEVSGAVRDVERHMAAAVVRSSSAWGEGFQNILVKGALARAVVVSTDVGDARWIVGDPRFVVPPRDPDAIADALETALRLASAERDAVVGELRTRAQSEFSLEVMRERLSRMFLEVAQGALLSVHPGG